MINAVLAGSIIQALHTAARRMSLEFSKDYYGLRNFYSRFQWPLRKLLRTFIPWLVMIINDFTGKNKARLARIRAERT